MRRRLFSILSALSLVLFVATAGLGIRSYWRSDEVEYYPGTAVYGVDTLNGVLGIHWRIHHVGFPPGVYVRSYDAEDCHSEVGQFYFEHGPSQGVYCFPIWLLLPFMAFCPVCWLIVRKRTHLRRARGLCPKCGYDLRASKDRCPECGTPIPAQMASSSGEG